MNSGRIIKHDGNKGYVMINNTVVQSKLLSMQAKGLFCYMQSLPTDWVVYKKELPNHFTNGRDAVLAAFDELIKFGLIEQIKNTTQKGKFAWDYKIYPTSESLNSDQKSTPDSQEVVPENPKSVDETAPENPARLSSVYTKTEEEKNIPTKKGLDISSPEKPPQTETDKPEPPPIHTLSPDEEKKLRVKGINPKTGRAYPSVLMGIEKKILNWEDKYPNAPGSDLPAIYNRTAQWMEYEVADGIKLSLPQQIALDPEWWQWTFEKLNNAQNFKELRQRLQNAITSKLKQQKAL